MRQPVIVALLCVAQLGIVPAAARAQTPLARSAATSAPRRGPSDPNEIAAFFDGLMIGQMMDKHVAGATISVVRDGKILFAKGYGWADLAHHRPVSADSTLFRIGSISKLFTWTAVMQQVEAGTLDLKRDVNAYLDFTIPATYPQPITLFNLMTHTPGFEDRSFALFSQSTAPRGRFLATHMPARVRPPGTYISYSNYGAALAGYIVERVTHTPWETYIEQHILDSLEMPNATGRQPLPPSLAPQMSVGYAWEGGALVPKPFEVLLPFAPAGAMSASATSMAHFMIAQLQDGVYDRRRILGDSIARFMHGRAFAQDSRLDGYDYGFYEQTSHGVHLIGHGGDTQWFHSDLTLAPEEGWGIFVSYNSQPGGSLSFGPFLQAVLDHYYPAETASLSEASGGPVDPAYLGSYRVNRSSYTTLEKVTGLFSNISVARDPKHAGVLVVHSPLGTERFIGAGRDLFRQVDGDERIAFQRNAQGRVTHFFMNSAPILAMERLKWYQEPRFHQLLLAISLVLATVPFVMLSSWLLRRRFRQLAPPSAAERLARWAALLAAVLAVAFALGLVSVVSNPNEFIKGHAAALNVVLALPVLLAVDTIVLVGFTVRAWQRGWWGWWGRGHYTVVAIAGVVLVSVLAYWNLLGWRY